MPRARFVQNTLPTQVHQHPVPPVQGPDDATQEAVTNVPDVQNDAGLPQPPQVDTNAANPTESSRVIWDRGLKALLAALEAAKSPPDSAGPSSSSIPSTPSSPSTSSTPLLIPDISDVAPQALTQNPPVEEEPVLLQAETVAGDATGNEPHEAPSSEDEVPAPSAAPRNLKRRRSAVHVDVEELSDKENPEGEDKPRAVKKLKGRPLSRSSTLNVSVA